MARPSFEEMRAGTKLQYDDVSYVSSTDIELGYDERLIDRRFGMNPKRNRGTKPTKKAKVIKPSQGKLEAKVIKRGKLQAAI